MADASNLINFERFLKGEPLSEELAKLRMGDAGEEPEPDFARVVAAANEPERQEDELTRAELLDLKELRVSKGWQVLERMQQISLRAHTKSAINLSRTAPLENQVQIANAWAYIMALERAKKELGYMVDAGLKRLDAENR